MSRIMMMTSATAALLVSASALAWGWHAGTRLTLVTSDGARIVGVGAVEEGKVEITLERGFAGYAVLMVEGPEGTLETFDVVVEADSTIMVGADGSYSNLSESTARAGLGYQLSLDGSAASDNAKGSESRLSSRPLGSESGAIVAGESELEALGLARRAVSGELQGQDLAEEAKKLGSDSNSKPSEDRESQ